jgi:DNA-binding FadR family transcriptional regulator
MAGPVTGRRQSIAQQTADRLRADLASGRWTPGDKLPSEASLAAEYGVGRSSAREAVQSLSRDGLLDVRHGTGIFVSLSPAPDRPKLTITDVARRARIIEVYEVRRAIEVEAARLAATRADDATLARLEDLLELRRRLVGRDTAAFIQADLDFHTAVVAAAANPLLAELFAQLLDPLRRAVTALVDEEPGHPDTHADHTALLAALRARDPEQAAASTVTHFDKTLSVLRPR